MRARTLLPAATLIVIVSAGGLLRLVDLSRAGLGNLFYASAVRSMGLSVHNFVYAAYDPAGTLTVDKPPLALWLQVISTKFLGIDGTALILPMALAGTVAIPLTFGAGRRSHGVAVGLLGAALLAVFPESVATARDSTMDALMMAMLAGAAWILVIAVEERRGGMLLLWAAVMGLVFNVKFFEGFVVLPAASLYIALRWRAELRARARTIALSAAVLLAVSLSWVTAVELTPSSERPIVLNDPSNSAFGLVLRYNGIERVLPGEVTIFQPVEGAAASEALEAAALSFGVGDAGPLRLFRGSNGPLFGVTVLLALGGVAMILWRRRDWLDGPGALWSAWFLTGIVLFSLSNRAAAHYAESYAPALAVMGAVGLVEGWRLRSGLARAALPLAVLGVAAFGWWAVRGYPALQDATYAAALFAAAGALVALFALSPRVPAGPQRMFRIVPAVAVLALPLAVSVWIATEAPGGGQITRPNPVIYAVDDPPGIGERSVPAELIAARPGAAGARYAFAIDGVNSAGEAIAYSGASVLPLWNEYQRRDVLEPSDLEARLAGGQVAYVLLSRTRIAAGLTSTIHAVVQEQCQPERGRGVGRRWLLWRCPAP
jgi:4-amino-4-deoxy-L-arabinose transferase-like glycosyltransferase